MLQDPNFLPVLQTFGWDGKAHVPCMSLYSYAEPDEDADVFLSYGVIGQAQNNYMMRSAMSQQGLNIEQVHIAAAANLQRYISELEWNPADMGSFKMLSLNGNAHTAAGVCLADFLKPLHEYFNNEVIYLAIPNRFTILVSDDSYYFAKHIHQKHQEAVTNNFGALSPHLIVMQSGSIIGQAQLDEEPQPLQAVPQAAPQVEVPQINVTAPAHGTPDDIILNPAIQQATGGYPAAEEEQQEEQPQQEVSPIGSRLKSKAKPRGGAKSRKKSGGGALRAGGSKRSRKEEAPAPALDGDMDEETLQMIILSGPVSVFLMVAAADGNIDKKEMKAFVKEVVAVGKKPGTPDPLKEMFQAIPSAAGDIIEHLMDEGLDLEILVKSMLYSASGVEETFGKRTGRKYNQILVNIAVAIASASGGFLGMGSKIDKHERIVINAIKKALRIK